MKRLERGWVGHYCLADKCQFRRNTLLDDRIVISTVGACVDGDKYREIGIDRYFETMAFYAEDTEYRDADVQQEIGMLKRLDGPIQWTSDMQANEMHEDAVNEIIARIESGEL